MFGHSWKFIIGVLLLITNQPIGWGGIALCAYLTHKTKKKIYCVYGTIVYAISWGMVGLGLLLAGKEGLVLAKKLLKAYGWQIGILVVIIAGVALYVRKRKKKKA